ncbi:MAG: ferrous iron transporter B [Oscillospiraceae bacterium]|nr:ferrous iron transporter B [Oscillospiraceae bacterium]
MGLTFSSTGRNLRKTPILPQTGITIALMGNPNVGKSTLFNALTGKNQHTGNWPGKTVELATGCFSHKGQNYTLVDLPGTYSLVSKSPEEEVANDYLLCANPRLVAVVCDATCLRRNLALVLQVMQKHPRVIVCLNLMDEAKRDGIRVDISKLERLLGVPVVPMSAGTGQGMDEFLDRLAPTLKSDGHQHTLLSPHATFTGSKERKDQFLAQYFVREGEKIATQCLGGNTKRKTLSQRMDTIAMGKITGPICMLLLLFLTLWITIIGANYPSQMLQECFDRLGLLLQKALTSTPDFIRLPLLDGVYATMTRVIAVMLPPMAIFFPLFTLLEDWGYLPRVAFFTDHAFQCCGSCGKQALTMCMGLGCNAAGVMGCRIIDSPRERNIAVITNAMVPCNGRFPMLISLISAFFGSKGAYSALILMAFLLLGVVMTLLQSKLLSHTLLRGDESSFAMELPPFRRPQMRKLLYRSFVDRTLFVLGRAVMVAAPAGLILWVCTAIAPNGISLLTHISNFLEPMGRGLGVSGAVLAAFLLGTPANELVLPILLMALGVGDSALDLLGAGWTWQTALCAMVLCLFHWPCSTTILTAYRETKRLSITALTILVPTVTGVALCLLLRYFFALMA